MIGVKRWRVMGQILATPASDAGAIGIFAAFFLLTTSAPMVWALSESPAGRIVAGREHCAAARERRPRCRRPPKLYPPMKPKAPRQVKRARRAPRPKKSRAVITKPCRLRSNRRPRACASRKRDGSTPEPSKLSRKIERASVGKFADVSGSTRYYLQVRLKNGQTGYIPPSDVDLVKPTDKIFVLTQDAAVLDAPNHWAKKLAEVHRTHSVHVIGLALNYVQIRMKSGLTGFIPVTALQ